MSKDSSHNYIHLHHSHHADLFEEFCHPPSSSANVNSSNNLNTQAPASATNDPSDPSLQHVPGHFLPFESINLPPHLMPLNPEDEDGVVPDMHAAFGIAQVMEQSGVPESSGERTGRGLLGGQGREDVWRDFGLDELVAGVGRIGVSSRGQSERGKADGMRREGRRGGILSVR